MDEQNINATPETAEVEREDINELRQIRVDKLKALQEAGNDPFVITTAEQTMHSDEIVAKFEEIESSLENAGDNSELQNQIADKLLMNEVLYQRYISDSYRTRGREIVEWMELYYDMPGAVRMQKLAKIKQATVRKPFVPKIMTGPESIETAQSETWTAKKYSGSTEKNINKFKSANYLFSRCTS